LFTKFKLRNVDGKDQFEDIGQDVIWVRRNRVMSTDVLLIRYRILAFAKFEVYTALIYRILVVWLVCLAGKLTYPDIPLGPSDPRWWNRYVPPKYLFVLNNPL
jgi:hypothetical protein